MAGYGRRRVTRALAACVCLLLLSCSGSGITAVCTLIGCDSGLIVQVQGAIPEQLTISVRPPGGAPWTVQCGNAACARSLMFPDFTPDYVTIEVHGQGVSISQDVRPTYEVYEPNGSKCPPQCRIAKVPVSVS